MFDALFYIFFVLECVFSLFSTVNSPNPFENHIRLASSSYASIIHQMAKQTLDNSSKLKRITEWDGKKWKQKKTLIILVFWSVHRTWAKTRPNNFANKSINFLFVYHFIRKNTVDAVRSGKLNICNQKQTQPLFFLFFFYNRIYFFLDRNVTVLFSFVLTSSFSVIIVAIKVVFVSFSRQSFFYVGFVLSESQLQ